MNKESELGILDIISEQQRIINFLREQLLKTVEATSQLTEVCRELNKRIQILEIQNEVKH